VLLAEIHGKGLQDARNHEDYLTSVVFGHLRYLPPSIFWESLASLARGLPTEDGTEMTLSEAATLQGCPISSHTDLKAWFWSSHPAEGEPDLLLCFSGGPHVPLILLVESKLWSGKSGIGEWDQLVRYMRILDDLAALRLNLPTKACRFLVYLTPRDSLAEVEESFPRLAKATRERQRVFCLRWQDFVKVGKETAYRLSEPARTILSDVTSYLQKLALEYFDGFKKCDWLPDIVPSTGAFYKSPARRFQGFSRVTDLDSIQCRRGGWVQ
jgi:hypothetical protein